MSAHLNPLHEAIARLDALWADAGDATDFSRQQLVAANDALGAVHRLIGALHAEVAAGIASESRSELGADALAKQQGFRSPAQLIATTTGRSTGEAGQLVTVGQAIAPRSDLLGARLPARYPAVGAAVSSGTLSIGSAALLTGLLDRVRVKISPQQLDEAETLLADKAVTLSLDDVRKLVTRAEAWLDPDGVEPAQNDVRARRSLTVFERDGALHLNGIFDIETGASIRAALTGYVTAVFAARTETIDHDAPDADRRTVPQLQADALAAFCAHTLGCDNNTPALAGATVIVRINHDDLTAGNGYGTIDGCDQPISVGAVRRMAASGGVISCVLGTNSELLDWGREKRFFTRAQRLALVERDGGCAMCGLPPELTRAHHIAWWQRDTGPTNLNNGVLLCETCHHRIHDNGWNIRIDGTDPTTSRVWFIPPPYVDPTQTPRPGGLARYTLAA